RDGSGNLGTSADATFTTTTVPVCTAASPCKLFADTTSPAGLFGDGPINVGVKVRSDAAGYITGIRFYKNPNETNQTHTVSLWTGSGTLLASGTSSAASGETASGWQQVTFASPVQVTANTTYVASTHFPQ